MGPPGRALTRAQIDVGVRVQLPPGPSPNWAWRNSYYARIPLRSRHGNEEPGGPWEQSCAYWSRPGKPGIKAWKGLPSSPKWKFVKERAPVWFRKVHRPVSKSNVSVQFR